MESSSEDVLEWLKDWGNQFNKAASKPSFVEHLVALAKIEPAVQAHLEGYEPRMTSSHRDYEKTIKNYVDVKFPGRFSSYREIQSATAFRNRMIEHGLWDCFIAWANARMDFQQAGDLENSNIYKILNVVSRRLLAFSLVQPQKKISDDVQEHKEYTWADLCMSALKFAIPCAKPLSADQWLIPFSLAKQSDLEKVEVFLAPMGSSKAAKLPETLKEAREKAAAKKLETEKKKKQKSKAKATAKAKAKATANEKKRPAEDTEQFAPTMVDALGCTRVTMFGDDILNAINYTLEKVNPKHHRPDVISKCLDMACLFALEGNLSAAGITGNTVWTKARQTIKTLLNRAHSLQARISDPDLPDKDMAKASSPQAGSSGASKPDGEQEQDQTEDDAAAAVKHFVSILKNTNEKLFTGFLEANFSEFTAGRVITKGNDTVPFLNGETGKQKTGKQKTQLTTHNIVLVLVLDFGWN